MNVIDLGNALLRRRIFAALVVLLALLAGAVVWTKKTSQSQSNAIVLVSPPSYGDATDITGKNPLLNINSSLVQLASSLTDRMQSEEVVPALIKDGASVPFTMTNISSQSFSDSAPTAQIVITVTGADPAAVLVTAKAVVDETRKQLASMQTAVGAPAASQATLFTVSAPSTPSALKSTKLKAAGSAAGVVLVLGFLIIIIVDARLVARQRRLRHHVGTPLVGTTPTASPDAVAAAAPTVNGSSPAATNVGSANIGVTNGFGPIRLSNGTHTDGEAIPARGAISNRHGRGSSLAPSRHRR